MSINRIQKLLFSEYSEFEDMVLIESPFAQTTRDGIGVRQVSLGLTPTKLVVATDILPPAHECPVMYVPGLDPDIETFELVAIYPVECVNLSVFHRRKRQSLKAHFCNNCILYFELGGFEKRHMFWNLWCERVKFLCPEHAYSSHSETSVASSSSNSTLYLVSSKQVLSDSGLTQFWCKYQAGDFSKKRQKWTDRYLFLGPDFEESPLKYAPCRVGPTVSQFVIRPKMNIRPSSQLSPLPTKPNNVPTKTTVTTKSIQQINRFGSGVYEGCGQALYLPEEDYSQQRIFSQTYSQSSEALTTCAAYNQVASIDYLCLAENGVKTWEIGREAKPKVGDRGRHRRRYGFAPQPHFLNGLGPWTVSPGERYLTQVKRAVSLVTIRRPPLEPELRLEVSKRQLVASVSCEVLYFDGRLSPKTNMIRTAPKSPVIFFWTPEYWYRPRFAKDAYEELQSHLQKIQQYQSRTKKRAAKTLKRRVLRNWNRYKAEKISRSESNTTTAKNKHRRRKENNVSTKLSCKIDKDSSVTDIEKKSHETSFQFLKRILRMELVLTAWDFNSTTLTSQLTLIDRDLFLKIPSIEMGVLLCQRSSKNAPNIGAMIAFSHRISCLIASEVLREKSEKIRARFISRFINTANKCNQISNFQSCRSILCGLQSPAIYRLHATWSYLRKRHATKYLIFENLCRLYRDPRIPIYQQTFDRAAEQEPYLPYIGDIIAKLLDTVPSIEPSSTKSSLWQSVRKKESSTLRTSTIRSSQPDTEKSSSTSVSCALKKLLSALLRKQATEHQAHPTKNKRPIHQRTNTTIRVNIEKDQKFCEDDRIQRFQKATELLEKFQSAAKCYRIDRNELAMEYLLKARYKEDKGNFINSFNVENHKINHK